MTRVSRRAPRFGDAAGDPLDGLVNMFDVGIVLAVGFLLAALSFRGLSAAPSRDPAAPGVAVTAGPGEVLQTVPPSPELTAGQGTPVGQVYRLDDGRLVYVVPSSAVPSSAAPAPTSTP